MNKPLIINLFGQPSAGKSTCAAYVFSKLKSLGVEVELVTEFAKDKVWEESKVAFNNQAYIFGNQYYRISRCENKVDVIITDSPLLLSIVYNDTPSLKENFNNMVLDVHNYYNSLNYFIKRTNDFEEVGRIHNQEESDKIAQDILNLLDTNQIKYATIESCFCDYNIIINDVLKYLSN